MPTVDREKKDMSVIRNPKNFYSGLLFAGFGIAALAISSTYNMGTAFQMGPGYFPRALGVVLVAFGALLSVLSLRGSQEEDSKIVWRWKPLAIILSSVCVFALIGEWLGLIGSSLLLVLISSMAREGFNWKEAAIIGLILGVASVAVFVYGLGVPLPVWPTFIISG